MQIILIAVYAFIACIAVVIIACIRAKKNPARIDGSEDTDFISVISQANRARLDGKPWRMKYETYTTIAMLAGIVLAILGYLYHGIAYAIGGGIIGMFVPELIVQLQSSAKQQKFEERYARSLRQLSSALKSGMSLHQAVEDVAQSPYVHDSIRKEFAQLSSELKIGISVQDAFARFAERVGFADARDVAIAIRMQSATGGREADVIESIASNIGDRMMLRKEINSLFSGTKMTILVMDIAPFAVIGIMLLGASQFMSMYFESMSMLLLFIGLLVFMGIGSIITHRMVNKMRRECGIQ